MKYNKKEQLLDKINGLRLTSTNASDTLYNRGVVDAFRRTNEIHLYHTKEELEVGGFGEVFGNPMFEVKEVE